MSVHEDGRISLGSDKVHLESIHPDVNLPITVTGQPVAVTAIPAVGESFPISIYDGPNKDAFARLRVSDPTGIFDSQVQYDLHRILWEDSIVDSSGNAAVAHQANASSVLLTVEASDSIIRQSRHYIHYQPGKSQFILMTFTLASQDANVTQRVGYFDTNDGVFLEDDGSTHNLVIRTSTSGSPVDNAVPQASWNIDAFDGTGPSGHTIDWTASQILSIDLEWLGVGRVRTGFVIDGEMFLAHEFLNANVVTMPYMATANLPIRYQIIAGAGLVGSVSMRAICSQVSSEGGFELSRGLVFSPTNGRTVRSVGTSYIPLISIRPRATFNSKTNRGWIVPESFSLYTNDENVNVQLIWGGTLSADPTWNNVNADSITEYTVDATTITGGVIVSSGYAAASNQQSGELSGGLVSLYPLFLNIAGSHPTSPYTDVLTLAVASMAAQSTDCAGTIQIREIR